MSIIHLQLSRCSFSIRVQRFLWPRMYEVCINGGSFGKVSKATTNSHIKPIQTIMAAWSSAKRGRNQNPTRHFVSAAVWLKSTIKENSSDQLDDNLWGPVRMRNLNRKQSARYEVSKSSSSSFESVSWTEKSFSLTIDKFAATLARIRLFDDIPLFSRLSVIARSVWVPGPRIHYFKHTFGLLCAPLHSLSNLSNPTFCW